MARPTDTAAWRALQSHYDKVKGVELRQLFADDPKRGETLFAEGAGLYLDFSKNRITAETLELHVQLARECGLNPGEVLERVAALAKSVIAEAGMAESEVAAMPAGGHTILYQIRQAIERRALALLASLNENRDVPVPDAEVVEDRLIGV